jgi:hypothetical protein
VPTPRLLHPVPILLRQIDRRFTAEYDDNLREPIGQARREKKPVRLVAQMKIGDTDRPQASEGGVLERSDGYALFRTQDLRAADVELDRGDRIVQIGDEPNDREVDYYITKFVWLGHYPSAKGPTLVKAFFEDRHPSRQRGAL